MGAELSTLAIGAAIGHFVGGNNESQNDYCAFYHQYCREHRHNTSLPELDRGARRMWRRMSADERRSYWRNRLHDGNQTAVSSQSELSITTTSVSAASSITSMESEERNVNDMDMPDTEQQPREEQQQRQQPLEEAATGTA